MIGEELEGPSTSIPLPLRLSTLDPLQVRWALGPWAALPALPQPQYEQEEDPRSKAAQASLLGAHTKGKPTRLHMLYQGRVGFHACKLDVFFVCPPPQTGTSFGTTVYRNACPRVPAEARVMKDSELNIYRKTHEGVEMDNFDGEHPYLLQVLLVYTWYGREMTPCLTTV